MRLPRDGRQCSLHLLLLSRGKAYQVGDCVDVPPENCILDGPGPIFLPQLISGDGVFTVGVRLLVGTENPVDLVEEVTEKLVPLPGDSIEN